MLRATDKPAETLDIHTDIQSAKVQELHATAFAELHVWDASENLQMRREVLVTILTGQDVATIWVGVPEV